MNGAGTHLARLLALQVVLSATLVAVALWGYDRWVREPRTPRFAVVDVADIYKLKTSQLVGDMLNAGENKEGQAAVRGRADEFGNDVDQLLADLARDCNCVVLARPAVVAGGTVPDYTDALRRKLGL